MLCAQTPADSRESGDHYAGVEYFGSSQMTKLELQKLLGLRPGASPQAIAAAMARMKKQLDARHMEAHAEVVVAQPGELYVVVDIVDPGDEQAPVRKLRFPHHVDVTTEKPFLLLADLHKRLDQLRTEGRPFSESMSDGYKTYSDEPANEVVHEILKYAPKMRTEFLSVVESDPTPERRLQAVELLGWSGEPNHTAASLIGALDDTDPYVRAEVNRYIYARLKFLTPDFPFPLLAEELAHQLYRPSHEDRSKGLYCLLALCTMHPELLKEVSAEHEKRVRELADTSVLPSVKGPADKLLALFAEDANRRAHAPFPWMK